MVFFWYDFSYGICIKFSLISNLRCLLSEFSIAWYLVLLQNRNVIKALYIIELYASNLCVMKRNKDIFVSLLLFCSNISV